MATISRAIAIASTLTIGLGLGLPVSAQSACVPALPTDGDTVVCQGTGTGIDLPLVNNITLTNTGTINGPIDLNNGLRLTNTGTIDGGASKGIEADDGTVLDNSGTINSNADDGVELNDNSVVTNSGRITGNDDGVRMNDDGQLTNTGYISGFSGNGVEFDENGVLLNFGTITSLSDNDGVEAQSGSTLTNHGSVFGHGAGNGVQMEAGTLINTGTIGVNASTVGDGVFVVDNDGPTVITNSGSISGRLGVNVWVGNAQTQTLTNTGRITGESGAAINLGAADDTFIAGPGSVVSGKIDLGAGSDTFRTETDLAGFFDFVSAPETVQITGPFVQSGLQFVTFDRAILGSSDVGNGAGPAFATALTFGLLDRQTVPVQASQSALLDSNAGVWWSEGALARASADLDGRLQGYDGFETGLRLGFQRALSSDSAWGVAIGQTTKSTHFQDNLHQTDQRTSLIGVQRSWRVARATEVVLTGYAGRTSFEITGDPLAMGNGQTSGALYGLGAGVAHDLAGFSLKAEANYATQRLDAYTTNGSAGATIAARNTTSASGRVRVERDFDLADAALTPFMELAYRQDQNDDYTATALGQTTTFTDITRGGGMSWQTGVSYLRSLDNGGTFRAVAGLGGDNEQRDVWLGLRYEIALGR